MYSALMVLQLFSLPCLAQSSGNKTLDVDPSLLLAKAKLLTISRYGVDDVNSIISGLDSQMATIYNTNVIGYQVINIVNNQNHPVTVKFGKNGYVQKYCGEIINAKQYIDCNFVLVYSGNSHRYFLIKGFRTCEFYDLTMELKETTKTIFDIFPDSILSQLSLDFDCLYAKYVEKEKKTDECYQVCNSCVEIPIVE